MKARITHPLAAAVLGCFLTPALAQTAATAPASAQTAAASGGGMTASATTTPTSGGTTTSAGTTTATATADKRLPPVTRLTGEFSTLAGSSENASALINGLRSGSAITLNAAAPSDGGTANGTTSTTFTAPNGPMSYGNIRIALSLAREQLAQDGITDPTPQQLQAALVGDGSAGTAGILDRRAAGMGWGRIAHDMGTKLGPVLSGHGTKTATTSPATTQRGGQGSSHRHGGIVTAAGDGGSRHAAKATSDHGPRHGVQQQAQQRHGAGTPRVVTAAGTTTAPVYHGGGRSGGVVTASGGNGGNAPKKGGGFGKS